MAIGAIIGRAGELAELGIKVHPHMLRYACGYYLAELGLPHGTSRSIWGIARFKTQCVTPQGIQPGLTKSSGIRWDKLKTWLKMIRALS